MKKIIAIALIAIVAVTAAFATSGDKVHINATIKDKAATYSIAGSKVADASFVKSNTLTYDGTSGNDLGSADGITAYIRISRDQACSYSAAKTATLEIAFGDLTNGTDTVSVSSAVYQNGTKTSPGSLASKKVAFTDSFEAKTHYAADTNLVTLKVIYKAADADAAAALSAGTYSADITLTYSVQ